MKVKGLVVEDFINYKLPSMFIISSICNWKCCKEANIDISICQNSSLTDKKTIDISPEMLYNMYISNPITKAIVFGGLEPFDQFDEMLEIIDFFRKNGQKDPFVIYTGYNHSEVEKSVEVLQKYNNIIIKFGRFVPNQQYQYDSVLGIDLISDNQYAEQIS